MTMLNIEDRDVGHLAITFSAKAADCRRTINNIEFHGDLDNDIGGVNKTYYDMYVHLLSMYEGLLDQLGYNKWGNKK